jgi:hypothetical protein
MSSEQFNLKRVPNGDVLVRGGVIVDLIASPTTSTLVGYYDASGVPPVDDESNSFFPAFSLSGGSGRNIFIPQTGSQIDIPFGAFYPITNNKWVNGNGYDFSIEINSSTGQILIKDSVNTVAIASVGGFRLNERAQCSLAQSSGGPGTITKTIDLGTGTGICSFQFTSSGSGSTFSVVWNSTTVINVIGSGTVSFNKNLSSPTSATVTVVGGATTSGWSFNLGCPGGGSPPYTTNAVGTPDPFVASSTTYGNSLNGGVPFNLNCTFENGIQNKTALANSIDSIGINLNFVQDSYSRYYESLFRAFEILIKSTGAEFRDAFDVIAIRPVNDVNPENLTDPSGTYESTAYGLSKFGLEENFFIDINLNNSLSMDGGHVYQLRFSSGVFTRAEGPIFINGPIPSNTSTLKYLPVGSYDSTTDTLLQLWEGPILLR